MDVIEKSSSSIEITGTRNAIILNPFWCEKGWPSKQNFSAEVFHLVRRVIDDLKLSSCCHGTLLCS